MLKRLIPTFILIAYSAILIRLLVFKNVLFKLGPLRFRFLTEEGRANVVPFKTVLMYLLGEKGRMIALIELVGNIALFVPIGFLVPLVYRKITWKKTLALAVSTGLIIEGMQLIFRVGIFDIDDVILNGLGVMIGYWIFRILFGSYDENLALQKPTNKKWYLIMALVAACLLATGGGWILTLPTVVPSVNLSTDKLNWPSFGQAAVGADYLNFLI
jgi:glycopeptide antibiotics resistance protein